MYFRSKKSSLKKILNSFAYDFDNLTKSWQKSQDLSRCSYEWGCRKNNIVGNDAVFAGVSVFMVGYLDPWIRIVITVLMSFLIFLLYGPLIVNRDRN